MFPTVALPAADINPPVSKLPPVMLAVTETVVPVCVVALTLAPPRMLPPVMLPVADINPAVNKLPPVMLPAVLTLVAATIPTILPPVILPVADINPAVMIFPPITLPVAVTNVSTVTLPYMRVPELSLAIVVYLPQVIYRIYSAER